MKTQKPITKKDLKIMLHDFLQRLLTKEDVKAFTERIEKNVLDSVKDYAKTIKKFYSIINRKINRLDIKYSQNNLEIVKQQKFLLQKVKEHEKRLEKLEGEYWQN